MKWKKMKTLAITLFFTLLLLFEFSTAHDHDHDEDEDGGGGSTSSTQCTGDLSSLNLPFSTANFTCNSGWPSKGFVLMYQQTGESLWSFVLEASDNGGYISVGFSESGNMVGSSAVAGWVPATGGGIVKQYLLSGKKSSDCKPDTGSLVLSSTSIVRQGSKLYMAFQVTSTTAPSSKLVYAVGSQPSSDDLLPMHSSMSKSTVDYSTVETSSPTIDGSKTDVSSSCEKLSLGGGSNSSGDILFDTSSLSCSKVWSSQDFVIYYEQKTSNLWSFVISAPDNQGYISVGFSSNGRMVGTSAVAGWVPAGEAGTVKKYYLGGTKSSSCPPDEGNLNLVNPWIVLQTSRLYLGFQLNTTQLPETKLIYAVGPANSFPARSNYLLSEHIDMTSTTIDYTTGSSSSSSSGVTDTLRTSHGLFAILAFAALMPVGVIFARYFKHRDPFWFYAHITVQGVGFLCALICLVLGFALEDKVDNDVDGHKVFGIFIFGLVALQVMAILARPDKGAKIRKYWNWYHHNVGRLAIVFGIANIFYGIHLADEENSWNIGLGIFIGILVACFVALEVINIKRSRRNP